MRARTNQTGFTLIELVVVISILAILAAFAIPRFIALETQARIAALQGLEGSIRSAAALAHSLSIATNDPVDVVMEGQTIVLTFAYPDRDTIDNTLATTFGAAEAFNYAPATGLFTKVGAPTPATCSITYTASTGANLPPTIALATGGC